jgi:hypothetical protein
MILSTIILSSLLDPRCDPWDKFNINSSIVNASCLGNFNFFSERKKYSRERETHLNPDVLGLALAPAVFFNLIFKPPVVTVSYLADTSKIIECDVYIFSPVYDYWIFRLRWGRLEHGIRKRSVVGMAFWKWMTKLCL